jgi:DNA repair exonuclease SbcCD ATPase subunit
MDKPALEFITGAEPNTQECSKCHKIKSITEFRKDQHYCKDCQLTYAREYIKTIPKEKRQWYRRTEDIKGQNKRRSIKAQLLKVEMITAYGGCCSCCGETEIKFLTLEHLEGGGNEHRRQLYKSNRTWQDLKNRNWPKGHTVLCWNCQMGKTHYGECPHKLILHQFIQEVA